MDTSRRTVPGAQSIARAAALLRLVTSAGEQGLSVAEIARRAELTRPTTHRLLTALRHEGLVDQDEHSGAWMPGPELYLMGTVAASRYDITAIARDIVRSLAVRTEESAFLSVRRGDETVCLIREDGAFPIRSFVLSEGVRFPLGVASAGLAILAFLPPHDVDAYFERHPSSPSATARRTPSRACARVCARRRPAATPSTRAHRRGQLRHRGGRVHARGSPAVGAEPHGRRVPLLPERIPDLGRTLLAHAHQLTTRIAAGAR
jgi:DNA-binding IclR family transcriptional regulator